LSKRDAVIVSAVRTAIAKMGGALASLPVHYYAAEVLKEALRRARVAPEQVDDVILGNVLGGGGNLARLTALKTGLSLEIPGVTIDRQCGSGINAINYAAAHIRAGAGDIYVAGGAESYSQAPYLMFRPDQLYSTRPPQIRRFQLSPREIGDPDMGITAENLARKYGISREEQDAFALESQRRMTRAVDEDRFKEQIMPIHVPAGKGQTVVFDADEHLRRDTSMEALSRLKPAFLPDGTVTAGNSSGLNDAACALVVMSREKAEELGLKPLAVVREFAVAGVDPNIMGIGPVPAVRKVLTRSGMTLEQMDLIEFNEAFAAQVLACNRELNMDLEKVNVNGGAIAHGHPLGATGAILATKAVYELKRTGGRYALLAACIGGGQGIATILERENGGD
jgi:acetyl-CoA C-acetyltransferase